MIWFLLMLASLLSFAGQLCQKQATRPALRVGRRRHILTWLGLALACLGLGMIFWLLVLQSVPVGIAYPMLSLNFVLITLVARFVFHETIDRRHWLGVALVIGGVALLGQHA